MGRSILGVTANLTARVWKHKNGAFEGFSRDYGCTSLVWLEPHQWIVDAIRREKRIKTWKRDWKLRLIEEANPEWVDLAADWFVGVDPHWSPPEED